MIEFMQSSSAAHAPTAKLPASRRFFRRVKSMILRFEPIYRLCLKYQYGASSVSNTPNSPLPNGVLQSQAEWEEALRKGKALQLPLHRAEEKNWDHLAAVHAIVSSYPRSAVVLDAGAEFYSNVLPALFVYGFKHLYGMNLSFTDPARRGPIRYLPGDITRTGFPDSFFDAITCMSVIEHGVPLRPYFQEMFRLLRPGGILITSTDYYADGVDTKNQVAYGAPLKIFSRQEAKEILSMALECGFELTGPIDLDCTGRPIRWDLYNLEYTFLIFTLRKPAVSSGGAV
jgi:SAM-dependent methyltransferase